MSRIGKEPVKIPESVEFKMENDTVKVKGSRGELVLDVHPKVDIQIDEDKKTVSVSPKKENDIEARALWGTFRMHIANMIKGVTEGFEKKLEINGTGFRASVSGKKLIMELGFSHSVEIEAPEGIAFSVEKNEISVSGIDKQLVGQWAANVRSKKKVEPYKGKGIKYVDEYVIRKEGKKAASESS